MTLAGGDPDRLTLRGFVDVGFALLVDEFVRLGKDLISAIDAVSALGGGEPVPEVPSGADNAASMDTLMAAMAGVKGAPV